MTTLTGHLSLYATQSLKSIDNWMNVVQSNIGGSLVTAYKQVELNYAGGLTHEIRSTTNLKNGVMIGEQTLTTGNTRLNWKQGEVIGSTQETHFAIQGDGFFAVQKLDASLFTNTTTNGLFATYSGISPSPSTQGPAYLTRRGDFHWGKLAGDPNTNRILLLTTEGLAVLSDHGNSSNDNNLGPVSLEDYNNQTGTYPKVRPSVVQPSYDNPAASLPTTIVDYDELEYSRYGSTTLKFPTAVSLKTIVAGSGGLLDRWNVSDPASETRLIESALEASNVRVERNITELAVMGKIYNGFVQLIKVYNSNLDEVLAFIR